MINNFNFNISSKKKNVPITRNGLFYSEGDFQLEKSIGEEYFSHDTNQKIVLFSVDLSKTNLDNIYHESGKNNISFFAPVELKCLYEIKDAELKSYNQDKSLGTYQKVGRLTVNIYQDELDRNKCDIKKGDYIGIQTDTNHMEYFSVFNDGRVNFANTQNMNGYKPFFRTISAASVDKNEFNGE